MYINDHGNVLATCTITSKPTYIEDAGAKREEMTYIFAKCWETSPEGTQTVSVKLFFIGALAIPAMKLEPNKTLLIAGRERSKESVHWGRNRLERTVLVDYWSPREIDPCGMLEELKQRRENAAREKEYRELFAEYLTEAKPSILQWVVEYIRAARQAKAAGDGKEANKPLTTSGSSET